MPTPANALYEEYDHPRKGVVRQSSLLNPLLLKPRLGAVRPFASKTVNYCYIIVCGNNILPMGKRVTHDLPEGEYIYGICNEMGAEGVREVLVPRNVDPVASQERGPDMVAMNKLAVKMNVSKASEQRQFRESHYRPMHMSKRLGMKLVLPSDLHPEYSYGRVGERLNLIPD